MDIVDMEKSAIVKVRQLIREGWITREDFEEDFRFAEKELEIEEKMLQEIKEKFEQENK